MDRVIVNAVFEGGGVRGVALAGAAAAALDRGLAFEHVVGTSAGSLVASLVAAGYDGDELSTAVCAIDWSALLDPVLAARIPGIGRHLAYLLHHGLHHGNRLEAVWSDLLGAKGVVTFADLPAGSLSVVVTDISHARGVVLPEGLVRYGIEPDTFPIARAVRMSAAVPFLFKPVPLQDHHSGERVMFADGAMAANFPLGVARVDRPVLGFRLVDDVDDHPHMEIGGPASLARSVVVSGIRARYSLPRTREAGALLIDVPVAADLDFDVTPDTARRAFDRARASAASQLDHLEVAA